jgi:hypothetical protein
VSQDPQTIELQRQDIFGRMQRIENVEQEILCVRILLKRLQEKLDNAGDETKKGSIDISVNDIVVYTAIDDGKKWRM